VGMRFKYGQVNYKDKIIPQKKSRDNGILHVWNVKLHKYASTIHSGFWQLSYNRLSYCCKSLSLQQPFTSKTKY